MNFFEWFAAGGFRWFIPPWFIAFGLAAIFLMPKYIDNPPYFSWEYWSVNDENMAEQMWSREQRKKMARRIGAFAIAVGVFALLLMLCTA